MVRNKHKFKNRQNLLRIFKQMPEAVKVQAMADQKQGADEITATMKALVPVVKGDLKSTIRHFNSSNKFRVRRSIRAGGVGAPYGRRVEFTPGGGFFWPGYRHNKRRVKGRITRGIKKTHSQVISRNKRGR